MNDNYINDTDREIQLRKLKRELRLKRARRKKVFTCILSLFVTVAVVFILTISHCSIRTEANDGYKYYKEIVLTEGECLWTIAKDYVDYNHYRSINKYIDEVRNINHLNEDEVLYSGQRLIVPYYSSEYIY